MFLSPRLKFYLTLAFSIATVAVIGFFGASIPLKNIKRINAQVFEGRSALSSLSQQQGYKQELEKEAKELESYQANLDSFLLDRNKILDFIVELERLAKSTNNVHTISLSAGGDEKEKSDDRLFFRVSTQGTFKDIMKFLSEIETSQYHCDIVSLNIQGMENETVSANASFTIKVNVR